MKHAVALALVAAVGGYASAFAAGNTWFVDDDWYGRSGDGSSDAPFGTIQEAVDAKTTLAGDTILVRPGVYSNGVVSAATTGRHPCRLYVNKADLVIRSTGGRAVTHIVGKLDPTDAKGIGPEAVACVLVNQTGTFVLDGFTVRDGRTTATAGDADLGGGVYSVNTAEASVKKNHLYDCTVENCYSRGKYVGYMTVHRSLITRNPYANSTYRSAVGSCRLENSIVAFNGSDSEGCMGVMSSPMANCLVMGSWKALSYNGNVYNSILSMNYIDSADTDAQTVCTRCAFTEGRETWGAARHAMDVDCVYGQKASMLFVSTRLGDWRTLAGSGAIGIGDPSKLAEVAPLPEGYAYKDYYGLPIDTNAVSINAGVSQEVVTPQGGRCNFSGSGFLVCGQAFDKPMKVSNWEDFAYPTAWPQQWAISATDPDNAPLWNVTDSANTWCARHAPDRNGRIWVMPGAVGTTKTFTAKTVSEFRYLDPVNGDDDANDGSAARPWKTLQSITNIADGVETVVRCAAGEYALGEVVHQADSISRFVIGSGQKLHFVSTNAELTVIRGAAGDAADGVGLGGVRCLKNNSTTPVFFSGFTFRGGRTSANSDWGIGHGAVLLAADSAFTTFSDCVISNCLSQENCFFGAVLLERTLLADCGTKSGAPFSTHGASLASCVVRDMIVPIYIRLLSGTKAVNCTFLNDVADARDWSVFTMSETASKCSHACNCVFSDFGGRSAHDDTPNVLGSLFWKSDTGASFVDCRTGDPRFLDPAAGDCRVALGSAALEDGTFDSDDFRNLATSDREGNPLVCDGKVASGAYVRAAVAPYVSLVDSAGLLSLGGSPESEVLLLAPGESATVVIADGAKRPVVGVTVNGVTNLFTSSESLQISYDQALAAGGLLVEPVIGSGWYANANTDPSKGVVGDDANSGSQSAFPKRTLASALASAVAGDTVWAAPGRYDDGKMNVASKVMASRADVAAGVTLRSTDGAARTFIVGAPASAPDAYGCGTDAVRCAYLGAGARLEGFTLTGGRAQATAPQADATYAGAAVSAAAADAVVSDCVITDCAAQRYVIFQVVLERCRVLGNTAVGSQLVRGGRLDNVLFAENRVNGSAMQYVNGMVNVTWHSSNVRESDGSAITGELDYHDESTPKLAAVNCLFFACQVSKAYATTNCVLTHPYVAQRDWDCNWRKITDMGKLRLDADYRPVIEPENALVDAGTNLLVAATDAGGAPRVMNGTIDIGAMEADWRPVYSACIGRGVTVAAASPEVTRTAEGRVSLGGGSLTMAWAPGAVTSEIRFDVTGDGGLRLDHDGTVTGYAKGDGQAYRFNPADDSVQTFVFEGEAEILGVRRERGVVLILR